MASQYERDYAVLVREVLMTGEPRQGRNGDTVSKFAKTLTVYNTHQDFPLLYGRKINYKAAFGELAAMIRGPKTLKDFEDWGCNYWKQWADEHGNLELDYGNQWLDFLGVNQIEEVVRSLREAPHSRRHIISGWRPDRLGTLSLPCCHLLYQWYVRGNYLDLLWYQRSADLMVGVPFDVVVAAAMNICMAQEVGLRAGNVSLIFGDTHIYGEHLKGAQQYLDRVRTLGNTRTLYRYVGSNNKPLTRKVKFTPLDIEIQNYNPMEPIHFEVKA